MTNFKKFLSYFIYWLIQLSWGIILTSVGLVAAFVLLVAGRKPHLYGPNIYFEFGEKWGGLNLGPIFLCQKDANEYTKKHESGHAIQNMIYGPLMPFIITIPSACRYWLRTKETRLKKSLFNLYFLLVVLAVTVLLASITGLLLHWKVITIIIEIMRIYLLLVSIWMTLFEIPKYDKGNTDYYSIWFEKQANDLSFKIFYKEKKED